MKSLAQKIAEKHFNRFVKAGLALNDCELMGLTFLPDSNGDFTRGETGYKVNDNGTSRILTYLEIVKLSTEVRS